MSQFQPPSTPGPQGEPPFGSAGSFGESAPAPGGYGPAQPAVTSAAAPGHYQQPAPQQPAPQQQAQYEQSQFGRQQFGQQPYQQHPQGYPQAQAQQPGEQPYAAYPPQQPAPRGPSLLEDPERLGKVAWLSVVVFAALIALASILNAIADFTLWGMYGGVSSILTGVATLLKGLSLAAVLITVGKLVIDFFVSAALDRAEKRAVEAAEQDDAHGTQG